VTGFRLIVWRHLIGEPLRTTFTILGVGLGVAVYVAVASANLEVLRSFEDAVLGIAGRTTLQVSAAVSTPAGFDETIIERVQRTDGVVRAVPVVEVTAVYRSSSAPVVFQILGADLLEESSIREYQLVGGNRDEADWERYLAPDTMFLGRRLADRYGISMGSALDLVAGTSTRRVVVRGIVEGKGPAASVLEELAVMDIAAAQVTFDRLGRLDRIDIVSDPSRPVEEVRRAVQGVLPSGLIVKRPEQRNEQVERMTRAFRLNVASLSAVALLVGLFLVYNTMSFAVVRRRREIGILRSLGVTATGIAGLFLAEAVVIGVLGGLVGIACGTVLAHGALHAIGTTAGNLYDLRAVASTTTVSFGVLSQSVLLGVAVAVLGSWGPIREAGRVVPAQALAPKGYEMANALSVKSALKKAVGVLVLAAVAALPGPVQGLPVFGYLSALFLMVGFAFLSPVVLAAIGPCLRAVLPRGGYLARIAAGELERAPVRNTVAISALMIGLALMIGMSILIHSFRQTVDLWLDQTVKAEVIVAAPSWLGTGPHNLLPESMMDALRRVSGVVAVDAYRDTRMDVHGMPVAVISRDLLLHAAHSRYLFMEGDSASVLNEAVHADQVVVSETFARQFRLWRGDRVTLPTSSGPVKVAIAGVFYDYSTDGGKIVMDRALYRRLWGDQGVTVFPLYLAPDADAEAVRREIAVVLAGGPPVMTLTNGELKRAVLKIFDQTFAITYALEVIAVAVALLGILNALLAGLLERRGELAVLRAIGGTPDQIGRLILWESALLGVAGILLGVAAGLALSILLIEVINKQSFGWTVLFHPAPWAVVQAVAAAFVTTLLAGYYPAMRAARLSVAESLRYE